MRFLRRRDSVRLPQDVAPDDQRGRPSDGERTAGVDVYAAAYDVAVTSGRFETRARAMWGLIANGEGSLGWVAEHLSADEDRLADALGVLAHIGVPGTWRPRLSALADRLNDGEARDVLDEMLARSAPNEHEVPDDGELLCGGVLDAFTQRIWYIEATLEEVDAAQQEHARALADAGRGNLVLTRRHADLTEMLLLLEPWAMPSWKSLFIATDSPWTAVFSQGSDTTDASRIGRALGRRSVRTEFAPHIRRDGRVVSYGGCSMWMEHAGASIRTIQASFQSRWEWNEFGTPLPFERSDALSAKRIQDRFTLADLNAYCAALGIRRNDPRFYLPQGLTSEHDRSTWRRKTGRTMSSAEWRSTTM